MAANLDQLQATIDASQAEYVSAADELRKVLPNNLDRAALIEHLDEFGVDESLAALKTNPRDFSLTEHVDSDALMKLTEPLQRLSHCTEALDEALAAREKVLAARDPYHQRRLMINGRECTIDPLADTVTVIDAPDTVYQITPGPPQKERASKRAKTKERDREH